VSIWSVYVLVDPRTEEIRYVGVAKDTKVRLQTHIYEAKRAPGRNHRTCWIDSILRLGLKPILIVVETGCGNREESERVWIASFRAIGCELVNGTDGGEGAPGRVPSPETRAKQSAATKGRKKSPESVARMAAALRGRPGHKVSPETRQKISRARRSIVFSAETLARMSSAKLGRVVPPEVRKKMSERARGFKHSAESRARMSASRQAIVLSGHRMYPTALDKNKAYRQRRRELRANVHP